MAKVTNTSNGIAKKAYAMQSRNDGVREEFKTKKN
jgi:hypothetical protein